MHEALRAYSRLPCKELGVPLRLEWARALLDVGDRFGSASRATRVVELEPRNADALSVRREVLRAQASELGERPRARPRPARIAEPGRAVRARRHMDRPVVTMHNMFTRTT